MRLAPRYSIASRIWAWDEPRATNGTGESRGHPLASPRPVSCCAPASAAWRCWQCARNGCSPTITSSASRHQIGPADARGGGRGHELPRGAGRPQPFAARLPGRQGRRPLHRRCPGARPGLRACRLSDITPHILRHSFASLAASQRFSELTISGLLGHAPRGVTQRYVHLDTALIIAADQVAAEIARLLDGDELRNVRDIKQARTLASLRAVA